VIRDEEACYESSLYAIQIAKKYNTRLHILHISTEKELQLFTNMIPLKDKRITAEVCVHHLHFTSNDYEKLGYGIKCNPAIKDPHHRQALWQALLDDRLDVIATDHAPHTWAEKNEPYEKAHAGLPLVQHSLSLMLHYHKQGKISLENQLSDLRNDPMADRKIYQKEQLIRKKITKVENDIALWRNNLEFFGRSKNADKVKDEFNDKIKDATDHLKQLKEQLKMLKQA
jgi:hypothetical protein